MKQNIILIITIINISLLSIFMINTNNSIETINSNFNDLKIKQADMTNSLYDGIIQLHPEIPVQEFDNLNCKNCILTFVGDVGLTDDSVNTIKNIMDVNPDGIFFAGDLSYTSPDDWFDLTQNLDNSKVFPAMGNHEVGKDSFDVNNYPVEEWLSPYDIDSTYYSVSNNFIKVIIIDTELLEQNNFDEFQRQKQFIINELDSNTSNFEIVVMHRPFYSDQKTVDEYKNQLQPIFDKYEVELVVQAHNHNYQRYMSLSFDGIQNDKGQTYIGVGTGGRNLYESGDKVEHKILGFKDAGIFVLEINRNVAVGKFLSNNNEVLDEFEIQYIEDSNFYWGN